MEPNVLHVMFAFSPRILPTQLFLLILCSFSNGTHSFPRSYPTLCVLHIDFHAAFAFLCFLGNLFFLLNNFCSCFLNYVHVAHNFRTSHPK